MCFGARVDVDALAPRGGLRVETCPRGPVSCNALPRPLLPPLPCSAQVGVVHSSRLGEDDVKTLRSINFQIGDFLDVAIY